MTEPSLTNNASAVQSTPNKSVIAGEPENKSKDELNELQEIAENVLEDLEDSVIDCSLDAKYVPGIYPKNGKSLTDIKQDLLSLISRCEEEEEDEILISYLRPQKWMDGDVQRAALLSHTMAAYISTLSRKIADRVAMQLVSDTSLWLSKLFRFFDSFAFCSKDSKEGLIRIIRLALHSKYPRYGTVGFEVLFTRPPVIYFCDTLGTGLGIHLPFICAQLGLPLSCITPVPCMSTAPDGKYKMDPAALEKCIKDDASVSKNPLIVIVNSGHQLLGYVDNLQKIHEICIANNVWLHVQGHMLAGLALLQPPKVPLVVGDSLSLSLGKWIGFPYLPYVTLYRATDMSHVNLAGLGQSFYRQLDFLSVWVTLQTLGQENVVQRINQCFELGERLLDCVEKFPQLRIISKKRCSKDVADLASVSVTAMFETLIPVIVYQYAVIQSKEHDSPTKNPSYYDNLNSWLVQLLSRQVPNIKTDIIMLEEYGACLSLCPLENTHVLGTTAEDVEQYFHCLQHQMTILNATVVQKEKLYSEHKSHRKLQLVELSNWAGMGGVRYIPELWVDRLNELTDTGKADINRLNTELVAKLRASDSAFSLGEADDGMLCVRFGMVDDHLDMKELIALVIAGGQELEESSKLIDSMAEMIKHGIEEAKKELIQENQEKFMQEGILRQVPVIGSLVSWWYPTEQEAGIKGRSFNLNSGVVESTENIYKYHMQIKEGSKSPSTTAKVTVAASSSQPVSSNGHPTTSTENR